MPTRKNPEFWIMTYEGWGSEEDFLHIEGDEANTPLQAAVRLGEMDWNDQCSINGNNIVEEVGRYGTPLYVYRLEFGGAFEKVPPPPPPPQWRAVKRIGEK